MLEQISTYFTFEMVYLWLNIGVIPFWLMLIFLPNSKLGSIFVSSIFPIFILGGAYVYIVYKSFLGSYDFDSNFSLYLGINELSELFSNQELFNHFLDTLFGYKSFVWILDVKRWFKTFNINILNVFSNCYNLFYWSTRCFYLLDHSNVLCKKNKSI